MVGWAKPYWDPVWSELGRDRFHTCRVHAVSFCNRFPHRQAVTCTSKQQMQPSPLGDFSWWQPSWFVLLTVWFCSYNLLCGGMELSHLLFLLLFVVSPFWWLANKKVHCPSSGDAELWDTIRGNKPTVLCFWGRGFPVEYFKYILSGFSSTSCAHSHFNPSLL